MLSLGILISLTANAQQDIDYLDSDCFQQKGCQFFWSSIQESPESTVTQLDNGDYTICGDAQVCLRTSTDCINTFWLNGATIMNLTVTLRTGPGFSQTVGLPQTLSFQAGNNPFNPNLCFDIPTEGTYALHVRVEVGNRERIRLCDQGILPPMTIGSTYRPNQFTISQLDPIPDPSLTVGGFTFNNTNGNNFSAGPTINLCEEEELFGTISGIAPNSEISISGFRFSGFVLFSTCEYISTSSSFSIPFHDLECNSFNDFVNGGFTYVAVTVTSPLPRCAGGDGRVSETYYFNISKIALAIEYSHQSTDIINGGQLNSCYVDDGDGDVPITANSNNLGSIPELGAQTAGFIPSANSLVVGANLLSYRVRIRQLPIDPSAGINQTILFTLFDIPVGNGNLPTAGVFFRNLPGWLGQDPNWFETHTYVGGGGGNDVNNTANYEYELTVFAETDSPNCPELEYSSVFRICQDAIYFQEPGSGGGSALFAPTGNSELLFPNPAKSNITLPASLQSEGTIRVLNSTGGIVLSIENRDTNGQLDISNLSPGTYWLSTNTTSGDMKTFRFIKQ